MKPEKGAGFPISKWDRDLLKQRDAGGMGVHKTVPKQRGAAAELWNPPMVCRSASDRGNAGGIQRV